MVNEASKSSKNKMKKNNNNNNGGGGGGVNSNSENTLATMTTTGGGGGGGASTKSKRKSNEYESEKRREMNGNPMSSHGQANNNNLESTNSNDDDDAAITSSSSESSSNSLIAHELDRDENAYSVALTTRTVTDESNNRMTANIYKKSGGGVADSSSNEQQLQEIDLNLLNDIGDEFPHHQPHQSYHPTPGYSKPHTQPIIKHQQQQSSSSSSASTHLMQQHLNQRNAAKPQHLSDPNSIVNCSSTAGSGNGAALFTPQSQSQMKPQRLDSISLETLDQKICHLILDENELLQVKNQEEFINLFRNSKPSNDLDNGGVGSGGNDTGASLMQQPQGLSSVNSSTDSQNANKSRKNSSCNLNTCLNGAAVKKELLFNNSSGAFSAPHLNNNHHHHHTDRSSHLNHHHPCESLLETLMANHDDEALNTLSPSSFSAAAAMLPLQSSSAITDDKLVECVAIFGNTGDGKSHTLNHTFFNGRDIFRTSSKQETCTMGVWCAYDPNTKALIFDTEGLLGTSTNENTRMRLLLKVLAISDVVIYRTRAERLHNDLFHFLSEASVAYTKYFKDELRMAQSKLKLDTISSLGPRCIIFHETQHTDVLSDEVDANGQSRTVSHQLSERFDKLKLCFDAFSSMDYVGTRTFMKSGSLISDNSASMSTDFTKLAHKVRDYLYNNSVRPPRKLSSIYQALKALNEKFSGKMPEGRISTFADEYFTCSSVCLSCK